MSKNLERYNHLRYNSKGTARPDEFIDFLFHYTEIKAPEVDENQAWEIVQRKVIDKGAKRTTSSYGWLRIAASIAVFFTISVAIYLYTSSVDEIYVVANMKTLDVAFPDGSVGILNTSSSFTYPEKFGKERRVSFTGEAYFDIVKDQKPFVIEANGIEVKVLGTAFNLISTDSHVNLYVERGLVAFSKDGKETKVKAGSEASFDRKSNEIIFKEAPTPNVMSWRNGQFVFNKTPLKDAFKDLSEYYNVEFKVTNQKINNCRISTTFQDKSLKEVLVLLETILDVKADIKGSSVKISGQGC